MAHLWLDAGRQSGHDFLIWRMGLEVLRMKVQLVNWLVVLQDLYEVHNLFLCYALLTQPFKEISVKSLLLNHIALLSILLVLPKGRSHRVRVCFANLIVNF